MICVAPAPSSVKSRASRRLVVEPRAPAVARAAANVVADLLDDEARGYGRRDQAVAVVLDLVRAAASRSRASRADRRSIVALVEPVSKDVGSGEAQIVDGGERDVRR
jgi:hypothetical protein